MKKMKKLLSVTLIALLLLAAAGAVFGFLLPYFMADTAMPQGEMTLQEQSDGALLLSWPQAEGADQYRVEIFHGEELLYRNFADSHKNFPMPQLPEDLELTLRISSVAGYKTLVGKSIRISDDVLEAPLEGTFPGVRVLETYMDAGRQAVSIVVDPRNADAWQCRMLDEQGNVLLDQIVEDPFLVLQFGDAGLSLPPEGQRYYFKASALREDSGMLYYGAEAPAGSFLAKDLTQWNLAVSMEVPSKYKRTLHWSEIRGCSYEVQRSTGSGWETVKTVAAGEKRTYATPWLNPGKYEYRIVAVDPGDGHEEAVSDSVPFTVHKLTQYATIWALKDLPVYADSGWRRIADHVKQGEAFCVLEETNGLFAIRVNDRICYIDSNYCMINLPDYLGDLCSYNITNSVYSIYAVHEFGIPDVTGVVSPGYENICQDDGSFLVPLLYPTAQKLMKAARSAQKEGFRLKIYDSFRPYITTRDIYDRTEKILNDPLPEVTYTGEPRSTITDLPEEPRRDLDYLTYGWVMTGYNYVLNAFLANTGSMHNLGIALDLTIEDLKTGVEIPMQSSMHDLSQYSVLSRNTEDAKHLGKIMTGAGFGGLVSEWWHFQDNDARDKLALIKVANGVSAQCWVKDDTGWRWRDAKGNLFSGKTLEMNGKTYTFDSKGYLAE